MSGEHFGTDSSNDSKSNEVNLETRSSDNLQSCGDTGPKDQDDDKLHEMGEALEIAENRCNTLKEQLDQMRYLYRERGTLERNEEHRGVDMAPVSNPIPRQNSESINTDNSGAAVLTINNILNGITNSINRLSELHSYMDPDQRPSKKSKQSKTHENEMTGDNRNEKYPARRSSSWLFNEKKKETKKRSKRTKTPIFESGSLTQIKKTARGRPQPKEEASTTSVRNRKRFRRLTKTNKKSPIRRPGFNTMSSNHLVEIYHNTAVDYADSEEFLHSEHGPNERNSMRLSHADLRHKYSHKKDIQMPTISTTDYKDDDFTQTNARPEGLRSLSPIKEQETTTVDTFQPQPNQNCEADYFMNRSYQSPTISSKMKQVARGYFRNFSCRSIPFCAAQSITPSHNIGINIQQVMSIIKGRHNINGISPTLAHNIGVAAERLNNESVSAMVSNFGSRYGGTTPYVNPMNCPMQCNVNYQQLQEMAAEIPNEEVLEEEAINEEENKETKKKTDQVSWSIDPNTQNNCTCVGAPGVGFNQVVQKYQNYAPISNYSSNAGYSTQQNMYAQKIQQQASRKYKNIKSAYAQYNETNRKSKKESLGELSTTSANSSLPLQGKEKVLKGVLINLHEEFASLSDKYDELTKIVDDEKHSNPSNIEKLEDLEKKLNEKETEIQMVMSLYTEVVNLKQQVKALRNKATVSTALMDNQRRRFNNMCQRYQQGTQQDQSMQPQQIQQQQMQQQQMQQQQMQQMQQQQQQQQMYPYYAYQQQYPPHYWNSKQREGKNKAAVHLTKLLRQIQTYQEVFKTGGK